VLQPHTHDVPPCRLVLQPRTCRCNAVNCRFGPIAAMDALLDHLVRAINRLMLCKSHYAFLASVTLNAEEVGITWERRNPDAAKSN
jgi:hypothetical protein